MGYYQIKKGDTLWDISQATKKSVNELARRGNIKNASKINVGDSIELDDGDSEKIDNYFREKNIDKEHRWSSGKNKNSANTASKAVNVDSPSPKVSNNIKRNPPKKQRIFLDVQNDRGEDDITPFFSPSEHYEANKTTKNTPVVKADTNNSQRKEFNTAQKTASEKLLNTNNRNVPFISERKNTKKESVNEVNNRNEDSQAQIKEGNGVLDSVVGFLSRARDGIENFTSGAKNNLRNLANKTSDSAEKLSNEAQNLGSKAKNWAVRQFEKHNEFDAQTKFEPDNTVRDSEYDFRQQGRSISGDTIKVDENQYIIPTSYDVSTKRFKFRNRGDYTDVPDTEGADITAFSPFRRKNAKDKGTYIGVTSDGKLKAGDISEFGDDDYVSRTYSNNIEKFPTDKNGNFIWQQDSKHGNYSKNVPQAIVVNEDGTKSANFPLNILQNKSDSRGNTYGNITGGRVLVKVGNETRLLSGSFKDINNEFERMKKEHGVSYGTFYTLDNGSYNRGLRTKNNKITGENWKTYDNQNTSGGNVLYIDNSMTRLSDAERNKLKFQSDTLYTPNIRTVNSESYKSGHPLHNEKKGVVLHHTGYMDDPNLEKVTSQFLNKDDERSAHVVIGENGRRRVFANPDDVTFHAGLSRFNDRNNVNDFMLGIEFQGDTNKKPLSNSQIQSAVEYLKPILFKNKIRLEDIATHEQVRDSYNEYAKKTGATTGRHKPDISENDYARILSALKESVYYKK